MLQLGASIGSLELPVHTLLTVVSLGMPRRKFLVKFFDTVYAPFCQTLVPESREFNLSYVKPAAVLGRVVYFKTLCQAESLRRFKRLVKGCDIVSIEIVTYKYDLLDIWVSLVKQPLDAFAQSVLVLCRFATASRHPARGSVKRKMLQVPFLTYSLSSYRTPVLMEVKPSLASARS